MWRKPFSLTDARHLAWWIAVVFLLLVTVPGSAQDKPGPAPSSQASEVIATVENTPPITRGELDRAVRERVIRNFGATDKARVEAAVLKELIRERLAETLLTDEVIKATPDLQYALDTARRQVLLKHYIGTVTGFRAPSPEAVKAFIERNPDLFEGRKTYHYTELIVWGRERSSSQSLLDKMRDVARIDRPPPESLKLLADWLEETDILYGYGKLWQSTEQIEPQLRSVLQGLDASPRKVSLQTTGDEFRIVVLHGSYPDPLDPYRSRYAVAQMVAQQDRTAQAEARLDEALARANVTLHGGPVPGLDLPQRASVEQATPRHRRAPPIAEAWSVAAILMGAVAALYFVAEARPELMSYQRHFLLLRLRWNLTIRLLFAILLLGLMALPVLLILRQNPAPEDLLVPALAGTAFASLVLVLVWQMRALRCVRDRRWLGPVVLALTQLGLAAGLALTRP